MSDRGPFELGPKSGGVKAVVKTLVQPSHPIWKIIEGLVYIGGLAILVTHGLDGGYSSALDGEWVPAAHQGGVDLEDGAGVLGAVGGVSLLYRFLRR